MLDVATCRGLCKTNTVHSFTHARLRADGEDKVKLRGNCMTCGAETVVKVSRLRYDGMVRRHVSQALAPV